jgi:hypothetical protein
MSDGGMLSYQLAAPTGMVRGDCARLGDDRGHLAQ